MPEEVEASGPGGNGVVPVALSGDVAADSAREWLVSNGLGGWASSTVTGANTRRYHGLLVAAMDPPGGRVLLLSKVEETAIVVGVGLALSCNFYPGVVHPDGHTRLKSFHVDPFPAYTYEFDGAVLRKEIVPLYGRNCVLILYSLLEAPGPVTLLLEPLVNCRDCHCITTRPTWEFSQRPLDIAAAGGSGIRAACGVLIEPPWDGARLALWLACDAGTPSDPQAGYSARGLWYRDMEYPMERARGLEYREDHYCPGAFSVTLGKGSEAGLFALAVPATQVEAARLAAACAARLGPGRRPAEIRRAEADALHRRTAPAAGLAERAPAALRDLPFEEVMVRAADSFIVCVGRAEESETATSGGGGTEPRAAGGRPADGSSIVAGYHWFEEWGRDAFIALPGLCLATGRYADARSIIRHFAGHVKDGLIPNRIPSPGREAEYGSADASLWMIYALWKYLQYTSDVEFAAEMLGVVTSIVDAYLAGTRFGIRATPNGMLWQGEEGMQLTWMDAKVGARVITQRSGWAVEIQGLWYNALQSAARLCRMVPRGEADARRAAEYESVAAGMKKSFDLLMLDRRLGYALDVRNAEGSDASLRPNQLICMFLPFPLIDPAAARPALRLMMQRLHVPTGVRTLDPADPRYRGRYGGGVAERDEAYHQGTAWAWLTGPLVTALRRSDGYSRRSRELAGRLLLPFKAHLREAGLGTISELFDGDPPHAPGGCISQAWSVGEVYRAYVEEYLEAGPPPGPFAPEARGPGIRGGGPRTTVTEVLE